MLDGLAVLIVVALLSAGLWFAWRLVRGPASLRQGVALRLLCVVAVSLLATGALAHEVMNSRTVQVAGRLVSHVDTTEHVVALTFDDGPADAHADEVIGDLARHHAKGTFYVVGQNCRSDHRALVAVVDAGEEIGNHSFTHPRLVFVSQATVVREIESTDRMIREAGYRGPITFRPPFCKRLVAASYYLWRHRRVTVTWNLEADSNPKLAGDPQAMADYVAANVRPGSIVLFHVWGNQNSGARAALPRVLDGLAARGYRFVTVSELLALRR